MDVTWIRIVSWHAIRLMGRGGRYITLCGRTAPEAPEVRDTLPADRSCESCLRIVARKVDSG